MTPLTEATPSQIAFHQARKKRQARMQRAARRALLNAPTATSKFRALQRKALQTPARVEMPSQVATPHHHRAHVEERVKEIAVNAYRDGTMPDGKMTWVGSGVSTTLALRVKNAFYAIEGCPDRFDIESLRRSRKIAVWRQALMHALKIYTPRSLPEIGRVAGGRDHTTVLHAVRKVDAAIEAGETVAYENDGFTFHVRVI